MSTLDSVFGLSSCQTTRGQEGHAMQAKDVALTATRFLFEKSFLLTTTRFLFEQNFFLPTT
jgi:hypothetical protein